MQEFSVQIPGESAVGSTVELPGSERTTPEPVAFRPGTVIGGKFRIDRTLAEGGMGTVLAAYHLVLEQPVALKFLRAEEGSDWKALLELFKREAKAAARLKSEHVARVLDVAVTDDGMPYMVMEYLEGQSLDRVIKESGPLEIASAVEYAIQACECLAEAHAHGIVHRDVKPPNLFLVDRAPGIRSIKVLDFGISKFTLSAEVGSHASNVIIGTLCYMSPEQIRSSASVDHRADLWSIGATLYEMLSGKAPFDSSAELLELVDAIMFKPPVPLRELRPEVPEQLAAVISRCLSKNAGARFGSAGELAMALLPFADPSMRPLAERAASMRPIVRTTRSSSSSSDTSSHESGFLVTHGEPTPGQLMTPALRPPFVPRGLVIAALVASAVCVVTFTAAALISYARRAPASAVATAVAIEAPRPAPAAAGAETKELLVRATPSSARISIDGFPVQTNPFAARYPKNGAHVVEASAAGYESKREQVALAGDAVLDMTLERQGPAAVGGKRSLATSVGSVKQRSGRGASKIDQKTAQKVAQADRSAAMAPAPTTAPRRFQEVDPAGGQQPLRPIEVRNPYGDL